MILDEARIEGQANSVGRSSPRSRVRVGDVVEIAVTTENLHFFDPGDQTGAHGRLMMFDHQAILGVRSRCLGVR
jgi:hypothetical protein